MTDRIRILQVITGLGAGGAERLLLNLVKGLDPRRFESRIAVLNPARLEGLEAYGFSGTTIDLFDLNRDRLLNLRAFAQAVDQYRPQVIHAHMFHALMAAISGKAMSRARPAICFTGHSTYYRPMSRVLLNATKRFRNKNIVFGAGDGTALDEKTVVIPNGVTVLEGQPSRTGWRPGGPIRLLAVGRLSEEKNCLGAVRAVADSQLPGSVLEFVGTGPLQAAIGALASQLRVEKQIKVSGFSKDVPAHMRNADVFVMPSLCEGMPLALLEAGAAGMPVIATPVGVIPEILGSDRGILASVDEFPAALRRVADNPDQAVAMGERLRAHIVANYSIATTIRGHQQLYEELAAEAGLR
jgi:glycosyltransferase involved in cell wall biosynthesis